jgi:hypothetical protein
VKIGHTRRGDGGLSNQFDGQIVAAGLACDGTQKMQGVGMVRLKFQNLPTDRLGILKPTGPMMIRRNPQRLLNRELRHYRDLIASQTQAG